MSASPGRLVTSMLTAACIVAGCDAERRAQLDDAVVVAAGRAHRPTVAFDDSGTRAYVAWVSGDTTHDVLLARAGANGVFDAPVRVNDIPGDAAPHAQAPAQVAIGPEGNVYVVWQNNTVVDGRHFPASDLRFARSTDGGRTFEAAIHVNDDAGGPPASHTFHDMVVADDGTIYVSWIDSRTPTSTGGSMDTAGPEIRVARSSDRGNSFEPGVVVATKACPCCRTAMAVDGTTLYVAWRDVTDQSVRDVVVARSQDGGASWSSAAVVHADGWRIDGCPHAGPALALTDDGRLHVAWYTGAPDRPGIHYAVADSTLHFQPPRGLLTGAWVPPSLVTLASDGSDVIASWDDHRADASVLRLAPPATSDHAQEANGAAPSVAAAADTYLLAWLRNDSIFVHRGRMP